MSGESNLVFFKSIKPSPLEKSMEVENDYSLYGCMGVGTLLGMACFTYLLTLQILIPGKLFQDGNSGTICGWPKPLKPISDMPIRIKVPENFYVSTPKKIAKHDPIQTVHQAPMPETKHPAKVAGSLLQKLISSRSSRSDYSGYDLIGKVMKNLDQDKLSQAALLSRTDPTRLSGRIGKRGNAFNEGYYLGGNGNGNEHSVEVSLPKVNFDRLPPTAIPNPIIGKISEVDFVKGETARSSSAILAVIRSHSPGLRHLYNTYLRSNPGMQGKVTLRFAIAPSGQVVDIALVASSTGSAEFDDQVVEKIRSWRFDPVSALGNDIVTVPFNFSE